ncbi:energy-coupling factor transporter transmembrane component T [Companilactobacillus sp. FL22-1]|uniref:energy-coupling factor transporter transmembrane component T n=1 Tax=Companilactobacillus sp. FL22-1 TaxID=3373892 RepID=UPI003754BB1C
MNLLIKNFRENINSLTSFIYLVNVILITLLYNNPVILLGISCSLIIMASLTRKEKLKSYGQFSIVIFIVTVIFNLLLNQRGNDLLWQIPFVRITSESLVNALTLGLSFVNLLWAFYLYDSMIRIKSIFELLANLFKSIAIIFILTVKFIPEIIQIYQNTKAISRFRVAIMAERRNWLKRIRQTIDLNEVILNKAIANFMNVSDTLILKRYDTRQRHFGRIEFKKLDWFVVILSGASLLFNSVMTIMKFGKINFGSADLEISFSLVRTILLANCLFILLPLLIGGMNYLWWKLHSSKTTASNTITAKNYR